MAVLRRKTIAAIVARVTRACEEQDHDVRAEKLCGSCAWKLLKVVREKVRDLERQVKSQEARVRLCEGALVNVVRGATMDGSSERFSYERLNQIASDAVQESWRLRDAK